MKVLRNEGLRPSDIRCEVLDTLAVSWLLNPERNGGHGLKHLVKTFLGYEMTTFSQFAHYDQNSDVPVGLMGKYAIDDAIYLYRLADILYPKLSKQEIKVLRELEIPLVFIVETMEHYGFRVDKDKISKAGIEMEARVDELESKFKEILGPNADVASVKYLQRFFGDHWSTKGLIKKPSGQYSTNKDTLTKYVDGDLVASAFGKDLAKLILEHRKLSKLVSTYTKSLVEHCDEDDRIHGSFNQFGTATGRFSSSSPNLQNIPSSRTKEGDLLRKSFIASQGYCLIVADYSQIELRVAAHLSSDTVMTEIYNNDGDIHQMTADACDCIRFDAKAINFGLIYKMGAKTLAGRINKTPEEAQMYSDRYFEKYAGIRDWQDSWVARCRRLGYAQTITGRKRLLPKINSKNFGDKNSAERIAINTAVQGSAADIMKIGLRNFCRDMNSNGHSEYDFRVVGQVHDEVIVEVKESLGMSCMAILQNAMENAVKLSIKLVAEPCLANSWGEAK